MKKFNIILTSAVVAGAAMFTACSDGTETLLPSDAQENFFDVPADATGEEAQLRRDFRDKNGIFLLFQDTLFVGTDKFGIQRKETIDLGWTLTAYDDTEMQFEYYDDIDEMKSAVQIVEKYILPHIQGTSLSPYSVLMLKNLKKKSSKKFKVAETVKSFRCLAMNTGLFEDAGDDDEIKDIAANIMYAAISESLPSTGSDEMAPYYAIGDGCYGKRIKSKVSGWAKNPDITRLYEMGFISYEADEDDDPSYDYFYSKANDRNEFVKVMLRMSPEQFREKYGEYQLVMTKYEIMYNILTDIGYKF